VKGTEEQHAPLEAIVWGMLLTGGASKKHARCLKGPLSRFMVDLPPEMFETLIGVLVETCPNDVSPYVGEIKKAVQRERSNDQV